MSLNDILTALAAHADAFRQKTGVANKLSLTDMTKLMQYLTLGKLNLLKGTSNQYQELTGTGWLGVTTAKSNITPASLGETFTYTVDIKNVKGSPVNVQIYERDDRGYRYYRGSSPRISAGEEKELSVTETMEHKNCKYIEVSILGEADNPGSVLQVKNERLYRGTEPGIWTPNPADKVG